MLGWRRAKIRTGPMGNKKEGGGDTVDTHSLSHDVDNDDFRGAAAGLLLLILRGVARSGGELERAAISSSCFWGHL